MREIKFRAWLPKVKKMEYGIEKDGDLGDILADSNNGGEFYKVMQYTGLKDKNGTEIYGGDIVKFGEDEVLYEVYQHDSGSWDARGLSLWEWISENGSENEWEVIGNIYENPELLEGSNRYGRCGNCLYCGSNGITCGNEYNHGKPMMFINAGRACIYFWLNKNKFQKSDR